MRLVSLKRVPGRAVSLAEDWKLVLEAPVGFLDTRSDGQAAEVYISGSVVKLVGVDGRVDTFCLDADCCESTAAAVPFDEDRAICRLQRQRGRLVITWPVPAGPARRAGILTGPRQEVLEATARRSQGARDKAEGPQAPPLAASTPERVAAAAPHSERGLPALRASLDYSAKFGGIGDDDTDVCRADDHAVGTDAFASLPIAAGSDGPIGAAPATTVPVVPKGKPAQLASCDWSRFDNINEADATLSKEDLLKLWQRHRKSSRMRGESPLEYGAWIQRRQGRGVFGERRAADMAEAEASGRGLWCKTNLEAAFDREASLVDEIPDEELPPLALPELISALSKAPGASTKDVTEWARTELKLCLVQACSTDRVLGGVDPDVRVDAIVTSVEVKGGSAAIVVEGNQKICGYSFEVEVSYAANIAERPLPGEEAKACEVRYAGVIRIPDLSSCKLGEDLTARMRTSLSEPKPPKRLLPTLRPVLGRLELSVAFFVRRFDRRMLAKPIDNAS